MFSVTATYLWAGLARQRCYDQEVGALFDPSAVCTMGSAAQAWLPSLIQGDAIPTGAKACAAGQQCLPLYGGPAQGDNYDDVAASYSTWVQFITLQGWSAIMEAMQVPL